MRVFLLHGMARTAASMIVLSHRLKAAGHRPSLFGYHVTVTPLHVISRRLTRHVGKVMEKDATRAGAPQPPYAIVGHSLGNVIARLAVPDLPPGLHRFVMLAPPNRPPAVARALQANPVFRLLTGDAGRRLVDPGFFRDLPVPGVPTLVIAGTRGPSARWLPFRGETNDGILTVRETRLEGTEHVEVRGVHTFLMNRRDVTRAIRGFLE